MVGETQMGTKKQHIERTMLGIKFPNYQISNWLKSEAKVKNVKKQVAKVK